MTPWHSASGCVSVSLCTCVWSAAMTRIDGRPLASQCCCCVPAAPLDIGCCRPSMRSLQLTVQALFLEATAKLARASPAALSQQQASDLQVTFGKQGVCAVALPASVPRLNLLAATALMLNAPSSALLVFLSEPPACRTFASSGCWMPTALCPSPTHTTTRTG